MRHPRGIGKNHPKRRACMHAQCASVRSLALAASRLLSCRRFVDKITLSAGAISQELSPSHRSGSHRFSIAEEEAKLIGIEEAAGSIKR
jgi:hypothetical protein